MQASRLLSILLLLQARGRLTARALAAEFEVSDPHHRVSTRTTASKRQIRNRR
jgi:predicted DNA-binding transcriptional regulator YafY